MPIRIVLNRCGELADLFTDGSVDRVLKGCAEQGAKNAVAALGEGPEVSAPGSPPNTQTGDLESGIKANGNLVQSASGHSGFLELGTSKMAARPWLLQACVDVQKDVEQIARDALGL